MHPATVCWLKKGINKIQPNEFRQGVFVKRGKGLQTPHVANPKPIKDTVIEGIAHPWSMAFLLENEVLVSEKDGNLLKFNLLTKQKIIIKNCPNDLAIGIAIDASQYEPGIYPTSLNRRSGRFNMGIFECFVILINRQRHLLVKKHR